jgi:putative aldouronate transport system substrate-binding protein
MKRTLVLILAFLLVLVLFAGCNKDSGTTTTSTPAPAEGTPAPASSAPEATEEPSPYNFAKGKYETNEDGLPIAPYEYELPISTTDEVLSFWTACYTPEWLPPDTELGEMPGAVQFEEKTGIHIEYVTPPSANMSENFSILLASDDLCDIMTHASSYYGGPFKNAIVDEGYFVNLYDYKDYMPAFLYEITRDPDDRDLINTVFQEPTLIPQFIELKDKGALGGGYFTRGDWLADWGLTNEDIVTLDDLHNIMMLSKTDKGLDYPILLYSTVESTFYEFVCFDTYLCVNSFGFQPYVKDGQVRFANMNENDLQGITLYNQWFNEGLIDPDWTSYASNQDADDKIHQGAYNYIMAAPTGAAEMADTLEPGDTIGWVPLRKPLLYEGQTLHLGLSTSRQHYGTAAIATKCENIPLAVSWVDYRYSPSGAFDCTWGVEGVTFEYDENGKPRQTEFIYANENVPLMVWLLYATFNTITDPGMQYIEGQYAYPGGDQGLYALEFWPQVPYDGAYEWPRTLSTDDFSAEDRNAYNALATDILTFIAENFPQFVDNSKPLSDWDTYVQSLMSMGVNELLTMYQKYYDDYMASQA